MNTLAAKDRKLVVIIDPHIKKDPEYKIYEDGIKRGLFVHNSNKSVYYGKSFTHIFTYIMWFISQNKALYKIILAQCWPNESAWLDFINPETREYWAQMFSLENFKGTTEDVFIWNDMNEPSVFDGPERTLPKDLLHFDNWEHRDIHNVYGLHEVGLKV